MTSEMHRDTKVQRAETQQAKTPEQWELGHEPSDAPTRRVLLGVFLFLLVLFAGLAGGAMDIMLQGSGLKSAAPDGPPPIAATAPSLLAKPVAERRRMEAAQHARIDPALLDRARQELVKRGWPVPGSTPGAQHIARNHAEVRQ